MKYFYKNNTNILGGDDRNRQRRADRNKANK